jgi:hypothetical protein
MFSIPSAFIGLPTFIFNQLQWSLHDNDTLGKIYSIKRDRIQRIKLRCPCYNSLDVTRRAISSRYSRHHGTLATLITVLL